MKLLTELQYAGLSSLAGEHWGSGPKPKDSVKPHPSCPFKWVCLAQSECFSLGPQGLRATQRVISPERSEGR